MTRYLRVGANPRKVVPPVTVQPPTSAGVGSVVAWATSAPYTGGVGSESTTQTINMPSSRPSGSIIVVWFATIEGGDTSVTWPAGWTELAEDAVDPVLNLTVGYLVLTGANDPGNTIDVTIATALRNSAAVAGTITPPSGVSYTTVPPEAGSFVAGWGFDMSASTNPASLTPSWGAADVSTLYFCCIADDADRGTETAKDADFELEQTATLGASWPRVMVYSAQLTGTAEDPSTFTYTLSDVFNSIVVGLRFGGTTGELATGDHTHEGTVIDATGVTDGYVLTADGSGNAAWEASSAITDHGALSGLADDDHTQYFNSTRHDADDHSAVDHGTILGLADDDHTQYLNTTRHDADDHSATGFAKELLMQDGVTNPPVPIENEAQDDWLYQD